jgi:hypothetical protein
MPPLSADGAGTPIRETGESMHKLPVTPELGRARAHKSPTEGLDADGRQKVTYNQSVIVSENLYVR